VLEGRELSSMIRGMMAQVVEERVARYLSQEAPLPGEDPRAHPVDELKAWLKGGYKLDVAIRTDEDRPLADQTEEVSRAILDAYDRFYDERRKLLGPEVLQRVERFILLLKIDEKWKDHLHAMDQLRAAISLRSYAQIDPKIAYKQDAYEMFSQMIESLRNEVTQLVFQVKVEREDEAKLSSGLENAEYVHGAPAAPIPGAEAQAAQSAAATAPQGPVKPIVNKGPKVGRNDPCTCGSGKKYKRCCGQGKE
jgi:preprotein translocase subunit SecA